MSKWRSIGKFALAIAGATVPGVQQIEDAVVALKHAPTGDEKKAAVKTLVLDGLNTAEFLTDKDLLNDPEVGLAYDQFISAFVAFQNALAAAKAAKVGG